VTTPTYGTLDRRTQLERVVDQLNAYPPAVADHFGTFAATVGPNAVVGDGVADDGVALQALIDGAPEGSTVWLPKPAVRYKLTAPLVIDKALTLRGFRGTELRQATLNVSGIRVTASNVTLEDFSVTGPTGWPTTDTAAKGIEVVGAAGATSADPPTFLQTIVIRRVDVSQFFDALYMQYVDGFDLDRIDVWDCRYSGGMLLSCKNGRGTFLTATDIACVDVGGGVFEGYGWAASRNYGTLVHEPRSEAIDFVTCRATRVVGWEGFDTHGGKGIRFIDCVSTACKIGCTVGISLDQTGAKAFAPLECEVINFTADSRVTNGSAGHGLAFVGAVNDSGPTPVLVEAATGRIVGGNIIDHGDQTNGISGALYTYGQKSLAIEGVTIKRPGVAGIAVSFKTADLRISGVTIEDAWTNSGLTQGVGIHFVDGYATATVDGCNFVVGTKAATNKNTHAIRIANVPGDGTEVMIPTTNRLKIGVGGWANYVTDPGTKKVVPPTP
jgi:hypothetical protein